MKEQNNKMIKILRNAAFNAVLHKSGLDFLRTHGEVECVNFFVHRNTYDE